MCELFGFSAARETDVAPILKPFFARSVNHPDGWGLAVAEGGCVSIEKEPKPAFQSEYLKDRLTAPVTGKLILAHIRKASVGSIRYLNCHPFTGTDNRGKRWTLIHNGTLFQEPITAAYREGQLGSTDSERIFRLLLDKMNHQQTLHNRPLRLHELTYILHTILASLTEGNNCVNILMTDGEYLFTYHNKPHFLWYRTENGATYIATQPPTDAPDWQELPLCTVQVFRDGECIQSTGHMGEAFIPVTQ